MIGGVDIKEGGVGDREREDKGELVSLLELCERVLLRELGDGVKAGNPSKVLPGPISVGEACAIVSLMTLEVLSSKGGTELIPSSAGCLASWFWF